MGEEGTSTGYGRRVGPFRLMWQRDEVGGFYRVHFLVFGRDVGLELGWSKVNYWQNNKEGGGE